MTVLSPLFTLILYSFMTLSGVKEAFLFISIFLIIVLVTPQNLWKKTLAINDLEVLKLYLPRTFKILEVLSGYWMHNFRIIE